jgi:hypothetical protein
MDEIENPKAEVTVSWLTAEEGGRRSGPPTAPVYMATCVFVQDGDDDLPPDRPASADQISILLQQTENLGPTGGRYLAGFLVPELANDHLRPGAMLLIMEGPRTVGRAQVDTVL